VRSRNPRRRLWLLAIVIPAALLIAGALYQTLTVRNESGRFPAPGRLVNVAGTGERSERRLHLICLGQGEPTVIFESSIFGSALSSRAARDEVSAYTRVCSYDRMGMGWSDPGPATISIGQLTDDLERLTRQAEIRPPYILVPASIGGLTAELFARRHPDRVAGLVFVDAGNSIIEERVAKRLNCLEVEAACLIKTSARIGVLRLFDPLGLRKEHSFEAEQTMARLYRTEPMTTLCGVARGFRMTTEELRAAPQLSPRIPLIVLVHEKPDGLFPPGLASYAKSVDRDWLDLQQRFAQRASRGRWRVVQGSDHLIGNSQPHAVAVAVLEMLAEVRRIR
jgi:pimeloyl-ACP methyl ester carboxylesterase